MRYVLGPTFNASITATPVDPPAKTDLVPEFLGVDEGGSHLRFPPYDVAAVQAPAEIRTVFVAEGTAAPADAADYVASGLPASIGTPTLISTGCDVSLSLPAGLARGNYLVQVVLGYTI